MEPRRILKKVVLTHLNTIIDVEGTKKTLGEAIIDGTAKVEQIRHLNLSSMTGFPGNLYKKTSPNEPAYSALESMQEFLDTLEPYLSDQSLYEFVDLLCAAEFMLEHANSALRGDRMVKLALQLENKRHAFQLSDPFLSHMQIYAIPAYDAQSKNPEADFNRLIEFTYGLKDCYKLAKEFTGLKQPLKNEPSKSIDDYRKMIEENRISYPINFENRSFQTAKSIFKPNVVDFVYTEKNIYELKVLLQKTEKDLVADPTSAELQKKRDTYKTMLEMLLQKSMDSEANITTRNRSSTK